MYMETDGGGGGGDVFQKITLPLTKGSQEVSTWRMNEHQSPLDLRPWLSIQLSRTSGEASLPVASVAAQLQSQWLSVHPRSGL